MVPRPRVLATAIALALATTGCFLFRSSSREATLPPLEVTVVAGARLNPDAQGRSLPTLVRLYLLKSAARLEAAEFDPMYRQPKEVLGEDLLAVEEITLSPGETVRRRIERDKAARALAAVAIFRRPAGSSWRAVTPLGKPEERGQLTFAVDEYRIERK